jgi:hypothetical protein
VPVLSIVLPFADERDIDIALAATVVVNLHQMRTHALPPLYESGIRYQREQCLSIAVPESCERFLSARQVLSEGVGDCDDLSAYRVAELIHSGVDRKARAIVVKPGIGYHAIVARGDGSYEDPSHKLGMPLNQRTRMQLLAAIREREQWQRTNA